MRSNSGIIYLQMPAVARRDACSSDLMTTSSGGLVCSNDLKRREYQSTFGVILETGNAVDVSVC